MATRLAAAKRHDTVSQKLGLWRLAIVVAGIVLAWWNIWLLPLPVLAFLALVAYHERISGSAALEHRAIAYYERAVSRLDNHWAGVGESGERFRNPEHPYADDLDLFGNGSIFQRINTARTAAGEEQLATWLKHPAGRQQAEQRQLAVKELRSRLDLREDLALLGDNIRSELHPQSLLRWGQQPIEAVGRTVRLMAAAFTVAALCAFTGYMFQLWGYRPVVVLLLGQSIFALLMRDRVLRILAAVELPARDLRVLAHLLARLEKEPFASPALVRLKAQIEIAGVPASRRIARLHRLLELLDSRRNQMFAPVAAVLLWSTHFAFAVEQWRQASGPAVASWLMAVAEIEALSSLAAYAAEHPEDPFPEFSEESPLFDAEGVAHPLLPRERGVRNDVRLDGKDRLLLVSGSNMSGKSTLLRSVGLNVVLAWTGAPVCARRLRLSSLAVGASIRVQDSIQDGKSRFYAEISRLRQIMDMLSGPDPLLFLLDELLSGTNSHDRRIGAEAIVRNLVEARAIGLVTTHDLALAHVTASLGGHARNVHFQDHIEQGRIAFDYLMRPGVVEKSNALELMRSVGLRV